MDGTEPKIEPMEFIDVNNIKTEPLESVLKYDPLDIQIKEEDIKVEIKEEIEDDGFDSYNNDNNYDDNNDDENNDEEEDDDDTNSNQEDSNTMSPTSSLPYSPDSTVRVEILEQPMKKIRFRYLSELQGTPHGPVHGERSTRNHRTFPRVKLVGYDANPNEIIKVRCWLVDKTNLPRGQERPHCHSLVVRKCSPKPDKIVEEPHEVIVSRTNNYEAEFENMVVLHSVQRNLEKHYQEKTNQWNHRSSLPTSKMLAMSRQTPELSAREKKNVRDIIKSINKNEVYLYFEAFIEYRDSVNILCSAVSSAIRNLKNPVSGDLKICKVINSHGVCDGNTEVSVFVEKVPQDIKVKFYHETVNWEKFVSPDMIHRNYALSFRTPSYDPYIEEDTKVKFCLFRESDGAESNSMHFTYQPSELSSLYNSTKKRKRIEDESVQSPTSLVYHLLHNSDMKEKKHVISHSPSDNEDICIELPVDCEEILSNPDYWTTAEYDIMREINNGDCSGDVAVLNQWSGSSLEGRLKPEEDFVIMEDDGISETDKSLSNKTSRGDAIPMTNKAESSAKALLRNILFSVEFKNHINCLQRAVLIDRVDLLSKILTVIFNYLKKIKKASVFDTIKKIRNENYLTLLHMAVMFMKTNSAQAVHTLLRLGFDPMLKDKAGNTAYHLAVIFKSKPDTLLALITSKIGTREQVLDHLSTNNFDGFNILHIAVKNNNYKITEYILSEKLVFVNSKESSSGDTALHIAARCLHYKIAKLLIDNGANKEELNLSDYSPLQISVMQNDHKMAALLIKEGSDPHQECLSLKSQKFDNDNDFDLTRSLSENDAEDQSNETACYDSFALANDVKMYDILSGKLKFLKLTDDNDELDNHSSNSNEPLLSGDEVEKVCNILREGDKWKLLLEKLNIPTLQSVLGCNSFTNPEKVLVNYIVENKVKIFGEEDQRPKLAKMFLNIGLKPTEILNIH